MLREVENYLRRTGMTATAFGKLVARDPNLVHDMRNGREIKQRLTSKIKTQLDNAS